MTQLAFGNCNVLIRPLGHYPAQPLYTCGYRHPYVLTPNYTLLGSSDRPRQLDTLHAYMSHALDNKKRNKYHFVCELVLLVFIYEENQGLGGARVWKRC